MIKGITLDQVKAAKAAADDLHRNVNRLFWNADGSANAATRAVENILDRADDHASALCTMLQEAVEAFKPATTVDGLAALCHAIAYQRQVKLGYNGYVRTIEPHVIKDTSGGRTLLYALKIETGKAPTLRSYRVDRIQSVEVTSTPFVGPERD